MAPSYYHHLNRSPRESRNSRSAPGFPLSNPIRSRGYRQAFPPSSSPKSNSNFKQYHPFSKSRLGFSENVGPGLQNAMSLPGLGLPGLGHEEVSEQPQSAEAVTHVLPPSSEWRFEVAFGKYVKIRLLSGEAELFGSELIDGPTYTFTGTKAAIFTHNGCTIESSNDVLQSEYTAEETPMTEYVNVHFALESLRHEALVHGRPGPRVLVLGPANAGKTSLLKLLTAYAIRSDRQPIVANLDPQEGVLSLPGTLSAVAFKTILDVEEGWGSSPLSGPSATPVKLPLVYNYGLPEPVASDASAAHYKAVLSKLALAVSGRMNEDALARAAGLLIDTPAGLSTTTNPIAANIIEHIITEFSVSHILILGSERLYSDILKRWEGKPTSTPSNSTSNPALTNGASTTTPPETITIAKLPKSGGCVDRDSSFTASHRAAQIRAYFYGTSLALSPRQQQIEFSQLAVYRLNLGAVTSGQGGGAGGEVDVSAAMLQFLPGGDEGADTDDYNPTHLQPGSSSSTHPSFIHNNATTTSSGLYTRLPTASAALTNQLLTVMDADPDASEREIQEASVLGFLYVSDVTPDAAKVSVLAPVPGRVPRRALVWSQGWPGEVGGVV